jgi:hypothetical protein
LDEKAEKLPYEKMPSPLAANENPQKPPATIDKHTPTKLANEKPENVPPANKKPAAQPRAVSTTCEEKDSEDINSPIVLSELEAFHLKQCYNKVRVTDAKFRFFTILEISQANGDSINAKPFFDLFSGIFKVVDEEEA